MRIGPRTWVSKPTNKIKISPIGRFSDTSDEITGIPVISE
jgi:hypothetical protein